MNKVKATFYIPLIIFILAFIGFTANIYMDFKRNLEMGDTRRLMPSQDIIPNTFLPYTIIKYGTIELDIVKEKIEKEPNPYYLFEKEGHYYSVYPITTALLALPMYYIPVILEKIPNVDTHLNILKVFLLGRITATIYASLSVVLFYLILNKLDTLNTKWKFIFTLFYAFGTATYSISSRGLWMHTTSQLVISLIIYLILLKRDYKYLLGLLMGLAFSIRVTNIILIGPLFLYLYITKGPKYTFLTLLVTLPFVILNGIYNATIFGGILTDGYAARGDIHWNTSYLESIPGMLFSPARSFLFISPPLFLGFFGIIKVLINKEKNEYHLFFKFLALIFIVFFLVITKWWAWQGANAFGYRMFTEYLPILGIFSYLTINKLPKFGKSLVILLIVYSIYIQINAVVFKKSRCDAEDLWTIECLMPPQKMPIY